MKPDFTAPLSDVTVDEGYDVCLRCMVTGIPEPSVEWQCDGNVSRTKIVITCALIWFHRKSTSSLTQSQIDEVAMALHLQALSTVAAALPRCWRGEWTYPCGRFIFPNIFVHH